MNPKAQTLMIGIIFLCTGGLIAALAGCIGGGMPTHPSTSSDSTWAVTNHTPTLTEPLTVEQRIVLDELKNRHACDPSCLATREANDSYSEYGTPKQILRPEWQVLLPDTHFYVVPWVNHYQGTSQQVSTLFASYSEQLYEAKSYDLLLEANGILVTNENRELIAKALALMTIPDYLDTEVTFTKWEQVSYTTEEAAYPYNYHLQAWTKLGGWEVEWWFVFEDIHIEVVSGPITGQSGIGDYLEQPFDGLDFSFQSLFHDYVFVGR